MEVGDAAWCLGSHLDFLLRAARMKCKRLSSGGRDLLGPRFIPDGQGDRNTYLR